MQISIRTGKTTAARIPALRLSLKWLATNPTREGPAEHPKSPARARKTNIAVFPPGIAATDLLNVAGHRIPTDKPVKAQPINPTKGLGTMEMHKYDAMHRIQLDFMK